MNDLCEGIDKDSILCCILIGWLCFVTLTLCFITVTIVFDTVYNVGWPFRKRHQRNHCFTTVPLRQGPEQNCTVYKRWSEWPGWSPRSMTGPEWTLIKTHHNITCIFKYYLLLFPKKCVLVCLFRNGGLCRAGGGAGAEGGGVWLLGDQSGRAGGPTALPELDHTTNTQHPHQLLSGYNFHSDSKGAVRRRSSPAGRRTEEIITV